MQTSNFSEKLFLSNLLEYFTPVEAISTRDWAEREIFLPESKSPSNPGRFDAMVTPYLLKVYEAWDDPEVAILVAMKSAQIGWSQAILNCIFKSAVHDRNTVLMGFPRKDSNLDFYRMQILPILKANPILYNALTDHLNRISFRYIPFTHSVIKSGNMATPGDLKSVTVSKVVIEEPDDVKVDVRGQGDPIDLLKQRIKTIPYGGKIVFGGTPTQADFSQVARAYKSSNRMHYYVPCPRCNNLHELSFDNLKCEEWSGKRIDEEYGTHNPYTAHYECPYCKMCWDDADRVKAVLEALNFNELGWKAERAEMKDVVGLALNELLSPFKASNHIELAKSMLKAEVAYQQGQEELMKSFVNNRKGEAYAPKTTGLGLEELKAQRLNYPEGIVPFEGLALTAGIDVQWGKNGRFAICVRAWGRNGNSWLVQWVEIRGDDVLDYSDPVWDRLREYLNQPFVHASNPNKVMYISGAAMDAKDGHAAEVVYQFTNSMNEAWDAHGKKFFAIGGVGDLRFSNYDIYNEPSAMDVNTFGQQRKSLAERYGVTVYQIGAYRAHKEVLRRFNIQGNRDRFYHCESHHPNYEEQILSCRETFSSDTVRGQFKLITGRRKEAIDCEKMNMWLYIAMGYRNWLIKDWEEQERYVYNSK